MFEKKIGANFLELKNQKKYFAKKSMAEFLSYWISKFKKMIEEKMGAKFLSYWVLKVKKKIYKKKIGVKFLGLKKSKKKLGLNF
jgi:hypothetical protein